MKCGILSLQAVRQFPDIISLNLSGALHSQGHVSALGIQRLQNVCVAW